MTSNDRHASHDSPYRTGKHVPLSQNRNAPLSAVVTSAAESRPDLTNSFDEEDGLSNANGWPGSPSRAGAPNGPYSPGMRSLSSQQRRSHDTDGGTGEIQMQSFHDGAPPPPPVSHSWKKIDRWLEDNYAELYDNLCEGCTQNDVNELEHELDCSLPLEVRESLQIHDGQERGGLPTGVIFGCMLLDCEEIVHEWRNWRTVNEEFFQSIPAPQQPSSSKASAGSSSNSSWRQELLERQDSQPPGAVQKTYAHPGWIPLARDWGGNCIAIDLAPGPTGKWGQVIIFGRDYDCKYVVARSWAAFLAMVADDYSSGKAEVDDETGELKLKLFTKQNVEPPYLEILRWRADQKYGRRPRRRPASGLGVSANGKGRDSPYGSPSPSEERGRSPHRFNGRGSTQSPKTQLGMPSPLARVAEEVSSPVKSTPSPTGGEGVRELTPKEPAKDLIDMSTSGGADNGNSAGDKPGRDNPQDSVSEKTPDNNTAPSAARISEAENTGEMKTVAI